MVFLFRWIVIFSIFAQASLLGFPSGDACADALRELVCEDDFLLEEDDFDEILLFARTPTHGQTVRFIALLGFRLDGFIGALCALTGFIAPVFVLDYFFEWLVRSPPPSGISAFSLILLFVRALITGLFYREIFDLPRAPSPVRRACLVYLPAFVVLTFFGASCSALLLTGYMLQLFTCLRFHPR